MKLIIGLGNPGSQYENTRHNTGFIVLDELQKLLNFSEFQTNKKFEAEISEGISNSLLPLGEGAHRADNRERVILAKPQTFMNLSGKSIRTIMDFYKIPIEKIILLHDDLDINLGEFKISDDSSAAGHNGVQSVFDILGTQKIKRVRIGIEGAEKKKDRAMAGSDFVLQKFAPEELELIKRLVEEIIPIL